jgi:hypothetical protein
LTTPNGENEDTTANTVVSAALRLLMNLSFDAELQQQMVKAGLIPHLVELLGKNEEHRVLVLRLLYHLSIDDKSKSLFTFTDAIPLVSL